ncbi:MAG: RNA polymerase sigma factor [Candidatus Aminicenantes bacterium]
MIEKDQVFSDDDVVRSVREGNPRDFETLIDRYKNKIINFIHKMIYDYDEAQSLSQDVFLKVYETIERYRMQDNFQAFIFTIAKNITLNYIKKQKRVLFFSSFAPGNGNAAKEYENRYFQAEETQQEAMEKDQREELLTAALKTLNENQRIALIMKVYLGFSYNQIAEITGWSIPKIETLISRAKSNLRDKIDSILNDGAPKGGAGRKIKRLREEVQEKSRNDVLRVRTI